MATAEGFLGVKPHTNSTLSASNSKPSTSTKLVQNRSINEDASPSNHIPARDSHELVAPVTRRCAGKVSRSAHCHAQVFSSHPHTRTPVAHGGKEKGGRTSLQRIADLLHKIQQCRSACRAGANHDKTWRQRGAEGGRAHENLASLHEAHWHRLSLSTRAKHSRARPGAPGTAPTQRAPRTE